MKKKCDCHLKEQQVCDICQGVNPELAKHHEHRIYRKMVERCLTVFYNQTKTQAETLVNAWWQRLGKSGAFKAGLFLHSEPMNTAAHLVDAEVLVIGKHRDLYHQLWEECQKGVYDEIHLDRPTNRQRFVSLLYEARAASEEVDNYNLHSDKPKEVKKWKQLIKEQEDVFHRLHEHCRTFMDWDKVVK